jgi:hypothetical protein
LLFHGARVIRRDESRGAEKATAKGVVAMPFAATTIAPPFTLRLTWIAPLASIVSIDSIIAPRALVSAIVETLCSAPE